MAELMTSLGFTWPSRVEGKFLCLYMLSQRSTIIRRIFDWLES